MPWRNSWATLRTEAPHEVEAVHLDRPHADIQPGGRCHGSYFPVTPVWESLSGEVKPSDRLPRMGAALTTFTAFPLLGCRAVFVVFADFFAWGRLRGAIKFVPQNSTEHKLRLGKSVKAITRLPGRRRYGDVVDIRGVLEGLRPSWVDTFVSHSSGTDSPDNDRRGPGVPAALRCKQPTSRCCVPSKNPS